MRYSPLYLLKLVVGRKRNLTWYKINVFFAFYFSIKRNQRRFCKI